ncbi:hypothetical protein GCM10023085_62240 [Actinomadura viridis]
MGEPPKAESRRSRPSRHYTVTPRDDSLHSDAPLSRRPDPQSVKAVMLLDGRVNVVKVAMRLPFTPVPPVRELRCWQVPIGMEIT